MKIKILTLKKDNPTWGYGKIANEIGCHKSTVEFHLNPKTARKKVLRQKINVRRKKEILIQEFGGGCKICGYNKCLSALEFHHLNPKEKKFDVTQRNRLLSFMREEALKCILVCANCHREIEEKQQDVA